jgi:hypothetical protein
VNRKKLLLALGCLVMLNASSLSPSFAASGGIVLDAASHAGDGSNVASISWSHSVTAGVSDAVLIVGAVSRDSVDADRVVTRVTYGGISLNAIRQDDEPVNNVHASLWYLMNPPTGAHTVVVDYASAVDVAFGVAASFAGVDQSAPISAHAGFTQSGGMTAAQNISHASGGWAVDVQYAGADMRVTPTSGQTPVVNQAVGAGRTNDNAVMTVKGPMSQAGVATMSYSYSESSQVALSIVSLKPADTAPTNPAPSITSVNPSSGPEGTTVTISGTDFGASQGTSTLRFNGTNASPTSWSSTQIVAPVPSGATSGNVQVTVAGVNSNGYPFTVTAPPQSLGFVQANYAVPQTPQSSVSVRFSLAQTAGDLNVIAIGWADTAAQIQSVVDSRGNVYRVAVGPTVQTGVATHAIYYAANIVSASANANAVTVTFSAPAAYPDIRIAEYRGVDPVNPIDVTSASMGSGSLSNSGTVQTTNANDLLVGANKVRTVTAGPGAGYTSRALTNPNGDILEDRIVTSPGSFSATAPVSPANYWIMQLVAFRAAGSPPPGPDTVPPTVPTGVSAQAQSTTQIGLSWAASTDNVGVSGYVVYRGGVQIADVPATTYTDSNLNSGTTYSYTVAAYDAARNFSAQSAAASATTGTTTKPGVYPIKVSSNGRYLVDQNNAPFLVTGDSARSLVGNISPADADAYFSARQAQGFNTIWINLLCNDGTGCRSDGNTFDGIPPFTTPGNLLTPNEAYFARVDQVLNLAAAHGITVMLDPAETRGWLSVLLANGVANSRAYGRYLGNRYRNFNNIVWAHGNDFQTWQTPEDDAVVRAVAMGILDNDNRHIHTVELNYLASGSYDDGSWIPIIGIDSAYTYYPTYAQVLKEYNRSSVPVVMVEANYEFENNHGWNTGTPGLLRRQEYWTLLSGGAGQLYGSYYTNHFEVDWQNQLQTPGATQMVHLKSLFEARRWFDLVPDQNHSVVVAGYGTYVDTGGPFGDNDYVTAARTTDGSLVMAYVPQLRTITVDMTRLAGSVNARWFDPANGAFVSIGSSMPNTGIRSFTSPGNNSDGDVDWILVLEVVP